MDIDQRLISKIINIAIDVDQRHQGSETATEISAFLSSLERGKAVADIIDIIDTVDVDYTTAKEFFAEVRSLIDVETANEKRTREHY